MKYTPIKGSTPDLIIEYLRTQPEGTKVPTAVLLEALAIEKPPGGLVPYMTSAIRAGLIKNEPDPADHRRSVWSLGDGVPLPKAGRDKPMSTPVVTMPAHPVLFPGATADASAPAPVSIKTAPAVAPAAAPATRPTETDPLGRDQHQAGAKLDAGKMRPGLVLGGFARALTEVVRVGTYGAAKYSDDGWMEVPDGVRRYEDAKLRHWLADRSGEVLDKDTQLMHAAHEAWNALARLDLLVRQREREAAQPAKAN